MPDDEPLVPEDDDPPLEEPDDPLLLEQSHGFWDSKIGTTVGGICSTRVPSGRCNRTCWKTR